MKIECNGVPCSTIESFIQNSINVFLKYLNNELLPVSVQIDAAGTVCALNASKEWDERQSHKPFYVFWVKRVTETRFSL
jgi:hypothetical protein